MATGRASGQRVLQTVLFTDIVKSTERLTEVGDAGWRALVQRHHSIVRGQIRRHRGREVDTAGDGFLVSFDQPLDAVECASDVVRSVRAVGIDVRAGVHTGEVERIGSKLGGIAVHTAARIMALAEPGEILVSSTVQDLVAGSGTEFVDRGVHELRGVPGERRLFAVVVPAVGEPSGALVVDAEPGRGKLSRRWIGIAVVAVGAIVLAGAAAVLMFLGGRVATLPNGPNSLVGLARSSGMQTAGAYLGGGPAAMAASRDALWIANLDGATVSWFDTTSSNQQAIGNVGSRPAVISAGEDGVWVADAFADRVIEIEPTTRTIAGSVTGVRASAIAIDFGSVWLADDVIDQVVRVDPATRAIAAAIAMPPASGPSALASAADRLWVGLGRAGEIVAIDPNSDQIVGDAIPFGGVSALATAAGTIWAAASAEDAIARVDPVSMRIAQRITVCDNPVALAVADDGVWVACSIGRRVWHVSTAGERVAEHLLNGLPTAVAVVDERVWITLRGD